LTLLALLLVAAILLLVLPFAGDRANESVPNEKASGDVAVARGPVAGGEAQGAEADPETRDQEESNPGERPDVSGKSVVEAARVLSEGGYEVAAIRTVKSDEEAGMALRVEPAAGSTVEPGASVVLVTSGGPTGRETRSF
ncbi:MAG TPA: PASTA domain-containing protein, partial [Rubrobacteraceae bacterium]|nr:PASTA domain-containing protein [Rubrobacteraceae bacterium]